MKYQTFIAVIVLLATSLVAAPAAPASAARTVPATVDVSLATPLEPAAVVDLAHRHALAVRELGYEVRVSAQTTVRGGYVVPDGEPIDTAVDTLLAKHAAFLDDALAKCALASATRAVDDPKPESFAALESQFRLLKDDLKAGRFRVSSLRVESGAAAARLLADGEVTGVSAAPNRPIAAPADSGTAKTSSGSHECWAPYYGIASVDRWSAYQTFYFNNTSCFGSESTYEAEAQVYNRNYADYDNYWSSNMPSAYLDTGFLDSIDTFTVGCARASQLATNTPYFTYLSLKPGSAATATVRIKGQLGYRNPNWCTATWCVFGIATTSSMATFTAPRTNVIYTY